MTELKPCPFCGSSELDTNCDKYYNNVVFVECNICSSRGSARYSEKDAIAAWNCRDEPLPNQEKIFADIRAERKRQTEKYGE